MSKTNRATDAAQWGKWVEEHQHAVVLALVARRVRLNEARQLAHDAFASLYEKWVQGRLAFLELPGLAISEANFLHQRRARFSALAEPLEARQLVDPRQTPEEIAVQRQKLERLSAAFEGLSPRAKAVFLACYENPSLPHSEVAQRIDLSVQRVRQTLCEVRSRLRRALDSGDVEPHPVSSPAPMVEEMKP